MKRLIVIALILVGGASFAFRVHEVPTQDMTPTSTPIVKESSSICQEEPTENETGRITYPVSKPYAALPNLGQIFTAFDCTREETIPKMYGVSDNRYTLGVTLEWKGGRTPDAAALILQVLGFKELSPGVWQHEEPLSLDELMELHALLRDPEIRSAIEREDCIWCG